ncbi:patched domain-containing protein 3-like [Saccostrea cucullata]|uniref:patched domain-containing protein 3-like n=1 Tax=Saccostrea cuccullata TaxID=36930 RepID=UPI002ECFF5B1
MLGLAGAFAPILGIGSALGAVSAIGIKFTSIVGVMPFLVVGIGIDDMFILMSGIAEAPSLGASSIEERMRYMLQKSGIAITITSITDLLAFGIGATSVFISIKNFCIFTGVAVFFCYLNQLFFLCPAICLNEKRTRQKRHFLSCMKIKSSNEVSKASLHKYCCTGDIPENRGDVESALEKYPKLFVIRFLLKPILGKIMIVIVFMAYIGASVYGAINLKQGLSLYNLVSDHSYFYKYSVWDEDYFTTEPIITFVGVALAVMFVITILFMPHPLMVFIVTITLVSILTGIFGFMHIWDLTLSSITMIHLVISVGFSVDFSVHICHAFLTVRSEKRDKILQLAFDKAGGPIFNAAFSSLLGIAMLGLSQSYIFQSFGKVMFLVIGFGLLHAALFLPLVLWFLFPCFSTKKDDKNNIQKPTPLFSICAEKYDKNDLSQDNKEPIQISNIIDLNVEISRKLNLKHISSCTHSANLSLKCIQSIPVVYAIDKVLAYTHKKVAIYSSGKHELSYWELFHSLED